MKRIILLLIILILIQDSYAQLWNQVQKAVASDRAITDRFGSSVSISGDYAIVGAPQEDHDVFGNNNLINSGSAYIFERNSNGTWNQVQKIVASNRHYEDYFGCSVSISMNYLVVGAYREDHDSAGVNGMQSTGSAYIYERDASGTWNQVQKIVASDRALQDQFGSSVSISGNNIIIGAPREDEDASGLNTIPSAGSAYIFKRDNNGIWNQVQKIVASDRNNADWFGTSVSIAHQYLIVGAPYEDHDVLGNNFLSYAGSAYIFERNTNGFWTQVKKITAPIRAASDKYGESVSISGGYAVVGAQGDSEDANELNIAIHAGASYILERDTNGIWSQIQKIVASDRSVHDLFGQSVSINGNSAIVGAYMEDEDTLAGTYMYQSGSAYIFRKDTNGIWNQAQKIFSFDRANEDWFGHTVSISENHCIVGTYREDEDQMGAYTLNEAGSAYLFEIDTCASNNVIFPICCLNFISPSGNYTWTTSGTYMDTIPNSMGCDSIITVNLTILNYTSSSLTITNCSPYTSPSGNYIWSTSGTYIDTVLNSNGCDSIITIYLTINSTNSIINQTSCNSYISPSGNYIWTSSGTYYDTIANSVSCDSIITINLTINNSTSSSINPIACYSYTSPSGNYIWANSGTYLDTILNSVGCDSIITINLTVNIVDTSVTQAGINLSANVSGAAYQWLMCNNGYLTIAGATNQSFTPPVNGSYAVKITENGCIDTSACFTINNVGIIKNSFGDEFNFYPNPTSGKVSVDLGKTYYRVDLKVSNILGKVVLSKSFKTTNQLSFEINESTGVYFVEIRTDEGKSAVFKVIKE